MPVAIISTSITVATADLDAAKELGNVGLFLPFVHLPFDKHRQLTRLQIFPLQILDDLLVVGVRPIDECWNRGFPDSFRSSESSRSEIQNPSLLLRGVRTNGDRRFDPMQPDAILQFLHALRTEFLAWLPWIFVNVLDWNLKRAP